MTTLTPSSPAAGEAIEVRIGKLMSGMTLDEKIGQMAQVNVGDDVSPESLQAIKDAIRAGRVGSVINSVDVGIVNELQRIAIEESRNGIPLLVGRDVIHGFKTVMPIPLGQASSFNPDVARSGARVAAREAAACGVNWTFAPMMDVCRDPRWGRIAESLGEDPLLASRLAVAMVEGFQGEDMAAPGAIAACAKHFAGYGESQSGRDYASTNVPENELRNVHLRPFHAAAEAGVSTFMTSFSDIDGIPATASEFLLRRVLREEWAYTGFVVSDWDSVRQLEIHGLTANDRESALEAIRAGVDMEMHGDAYLNHLAALVADGVIAESLVDDAVRRILRIKLQLGLFAGPYTNPATFPAAGGPDALRVAKEAALQSAVLLKNHAGALPLSPERLRSVAILGPLADAPREQLGTWVFDGEPAFSVTPLHAVHELVGGDMTVRHHPVLAYSRDTATDAFDEALALAQQTDATVLFLGEEAILSGEAHSRADIDLPGVQVELVRHLKQAGKPLIGVILAGRPLTLSNVVDDLDAILYAWHPGTMAGPALAELLFGIESPSGKTPVTFPRMVGQVPIYYNQKNTGKPPFPGGVVMLDDIDANAPQLSTGMTSYHLDAGYTPLFPFGHGLSYGHFAYDNIRVSSDSIALHETVTIAADLTNHGDRAAVEVAQLYVRDLVGNVTRPVKELKGFRRIRVEPQQTVSVSFTLSAGDLAFYGRDMTLGTELGEFHAWIGGSSDTGLRTGFRIE